MVLLREYNNPADTMQNESAGFCIDAQQLRASS